MIDTLALALSHGLLALAAWRLLFRPDLDNEDAPEQRPEANAGNGWADRLKARRRA